MKQKNEEVIKNLEEENRLLKKRIQLLEEYAQNSEPFKAKDKDKSQGSFWNITNQHLAVKELDKSRMHLNAIMENSLESIWSINTCYEIQFINNTFYNDFYNNFGVKLTNGTNLLRSIPLPIRAKWKERYDRGLNNESFTFVDEISVPNKTIYIEVYVNPIVVEGKVQGVSFYGRDTTERVAHEIQLAESNRMRELIMDNIPSFVFWKDLDSVYLGCNNNFAKVAGVGTPDKIVGKTDYDLPWKKEEADFCVKFDREVMESGIGKFNIEEPLRHANGKQSILETSKVPLKDEEGNIFGVLATFEDITAKKELRTELIKAKEKAEESDKLKSAFLANMSHEIRTPMNGILGFAELLASQELTVDEQESFIKIIQQSGNRMLNIINDLINISKIESGQTEVALSMMNINDQLKFLHDFFLSEAVAKGLKLSYACSLPDSDAHIRTDKEKLYAILTNLIKNAIKYTEKGTINFGYKANNNAYHFYVKDTGIGVPRDKQKHIFDRFVRADSDSYASIEGSGLGLSITKGYVEILGGTIHMESQKDKGSCFFFTLPCGQE